MYSQVYNPSLSKPGSASTTLKVICGWLVIFFALGISGWVGEFSENNWDFAGASRYGLQAMLMAGIVLSGIWVLRNRVDRGTPASIGLDEPAKAFKKLWFGISLVLIPLLIVIAFSTIFGWSEVQFNTSTDVLKKVLLNLVIIFFFEALPEELAFRGYIFSNLNATLNKWQAALVTVVLFVALPVILVFVQSTLLGMEINVGGSNTITLSYIITMFFFASFIVYLRIITRSIWTGVGFHLLFVGINRLIGSGERSDRLIQFTNITNETPLQIVLIACLLLIFLGLILYPILTKNKIDWKGVNTDN